VYVVQKEGAEDLLLPAIKECIKQIDIENGTMRVYLMPGLR
jgi:16S rRNA processing protein RimM